MSAAAHHSVASGTTDVTVFSGYTVLKGYWFQENAATAAAATVVIRDGTADTDPIVAVIELAADESIAPVWLGDGIVMTDGVFIEKSLGTSRGSVWLG